MTKRFGKAVRKMKNQDKMNSFLEKSSELVAKNLANRMKSMHELAAEKAGEDLPVSASATTALGMSPEETIEIVESVTEFDTEQDHKGTWPVVLSDGAGGFVTHAGYWRDIVTYDKEQDKFVSVKRPSTDPCFDNFQPTWPLRLKDGTVIKGVHIKESNMPVLRKDIKPLVEFGAFKMPPLPDEAFSGTTIDKMLKGGLKRGDLMVISSKTSDSYGKSLFWHYQNTARLSEYVNFKQEFIKANPDHTEEDFYKHLLENTELSTRLFWNSAVRFIISIIEGPSFDYELYGDTIDLPGIKKADPQKNLEWLSSLLMPKELLAAKLEIPFIVKPIDELPERKKYDRKEEVVIGGEKYIRYYMDDKEVGCDPAPAPSIYGNCAISRGMRIDDEIFHRHAYNSHGVPENKLENLDFDLPPGTLEKGKEIVDNLVDSAVRGPQLFNEFEHPDGKLGYIKAISEVSKDLGQANLRSGHSAGYLPAFTMEDGMFSARGHQKPDGSIDVLSFDYVRKED